MAETSLAIVQNIQNKKKQKCVDNAPQILTIAFVHSKRQ